MQFWTGRWWDRPEFEKLNSRAIRSISSYCMLVELSVIWTVRKIEFVSGIYLFDVLIMDLAFLRKLLNNLGNIFYNQGYYMELEETEGISCHRMSKKTFQDRRCWFISLQWKVICPIDFKFLSQYFGEHGAGQLMGKWSLRNGSLS